MDEAFLLENRATLRAMSVLICFNTFCYATKQD